MDTCLDLKAVESTWGAEDGSQIIMSCAQGMMEDGDLADWLWAKAG